jgi:ABC-type Fe3+-siderophore transport system permease subunit
MDTPTPEQRKRAEWDLLLADIEYRQEQLRLARQDHRWKPWQIVLPVVTGALTAGAALFAAGAAFMKLFGGGGAIWPT